MWSRNTILSSCRFKSLPALPPSHTSPPLPTPRSLFPVCVRVCMYACVSVRACIQQVQMCVHVCACVWMYSNRSSSVCNLLVYKQHTNQFATGTRRACVHSFGTCTLSHILIHTSPMPTCRIQSLLPRARRQWTLLQPSNMCEGCSNVCRHLRVCCCSAHIPIGMGMVIP